MAQGAKKQRALGWCKNKQEAEPHYQSPDHGAWRQGALIHNENCEVL